jgi:hypothetical protein
MEKLMWVNSNGAETSRTRPPGSPGCFSLGGLVKSLWRMEKIKLLGENLAKRRFKDSFDLGVLRKGATEHLKKLAEEL